MAGSEMDPIVPDFPARFNLCDYFLDRNLREGRGEKVALFCGAETRTCARRPASDRATGHA